MFSFPQKRVMVLESDQLLNAGVQSVLSTQNDLDVFGVSEKGLEEIFSAIDRLQPDVIILDEGDQVEDLVRLMKYIKQYPETRVIIMNVLDNQIQICNQQQILVRQLNDFLSAL